MITTHEKVEVVNLVFFRQLIVDFQTRLEQILKQLEFLLFSVKGRHRRCEGFRKFRDSANVVIEIG